MQILLLEIILSLRRPLYQAQGPEYPEHVVHVFTTSTLGPPLIRIC